MLKFKLKWQSNQAPKFLRGSVLGEMSCAFRPNEHKLCLGVIHHEFIIDHPVADVRESRFHCCNGGVLIEIIIWIESQIDTSIIGITVRCWQALANHIK